MKYYTNLSQNIGIDQVKDRATEMLNRYIPLVSKEMDTSSLDYLVKKIEIASLFVQ